MPWSLQGEVLEAVVQTSCKLRDELFGASTQGGSLVRLVLCDPGPAPRVCCM